MYEIYSQFLTLMVGKIKNLGCIHLYIFSKNNFNCKLQVDSIKFQHVKKKNGFLQNICDLQNS